MEPAQEAGQEEPADEACNAVPLPAPLQPTPEMVAAHNVSHVPFRSWCTACVRGRGRANAHRMIKDRNQDMIPVICMDYLADSHQPVLVVTDRKSKAHWGLAVPSKGIGHPYAATALMSALDDTGYKSVVIKSDNEPALEAVAKAVKQGWWG